MYYLLIKYKNTFLDDTLENIIDYLEDLSNCSPKSKHDTKIADRLSDVYFDLCPIPFCA